MTEQLPALQLNLSGELRCVDNTSEAFKDTLFEKHGFKIFFRPLTRTQAFALEKKFTKWRPKKGREETDTAALTIAKFCRQVVRWEGFKEGDKDVPCDEQHKRLLAEENAPFTNLINLAMFNEELGMLRKDDDDDVYDDGEQGEEDQEIKNV